MNGALSLIDYGVLALYGAAMLFMGAAIGRRQHSIDDFFIAGRRLPSWAVGISLLASMLSTITYLGLPGEMFRSGFGYLSREVGFPLVLLVVWFIIAPFFLKLRLTSAYEYLERRFDYTTRAIAASFCILLLVGWMSVVVLTAARAMAEIVRLDVPWFLGHNEPGFRNADVQLIIILVGIFSVIYTAMGGLRAVVWTDVIQFVVLLSGAVFTIAYITWRTASSPADWYAAWESYPYRETVEWYSWDVGNRSTIAFVSIGMVFWMICTHGANQVALQRYFSVPDVRAARRSYLISAVANLCLALLLAGVGYALIYYVLTQDTAFAEHVNSPDDKLRIAAQDAVFPQFIRFHLPSGLRGLVVAALFAAAMSTIDSGANSIATIVTIDFLRPHGLRSDARAELRLARYTTALMGAVIVVAAVLLHRISKGTDLITLCQKGFNCFLGPLGGLFVLAMFCWRARPATVIPAMLLGECVGVMASYSRELLHVDFSTHLVIPAAWSTTVLSGWLASWLVPGPISPEKTRWLWREVVYPKARSA